MTRRHNQLGLICASLMLSASGAWALPPCPDDPNAYWSNCVGTYTYASGATYVGEWVDGKANGQGMVTYDNDTIYVGEFKNNKANGQGTVTFANGEQYFGEFIEDKQNGQGTYTYPEGANYVGAFKDDKRNGQGTFTFADGTTYVGEFKDHTYNGQGTITFADGTIYAGELKDGKANGLGTVVYFAGGGYVGEWLDDEFNGQGTAVWPNGDVYVGEWLENKRNGQGTYTAFDGGTYVGEYKNDILNGQGTYTWPDGLRQEGIWENGMFKYANKTDPLVVSEAKSQDDEVLEAASGSGFAVSSDGYVITNNHVIEGCQEVAVYDGGRAVPVKVITYDLQNDLALLKGDFTPQTVFALSGDQPELLQDIYVAGYPFGNEVSSSIKVTKGIISSLAGIGNNFSNIQIDAALQVGNSGGPILDELGNVVGVAVSKLDAKYMYDNFGSIPENTNFGIKSSVVRSILESNGVFSPSPNRSEITRSELGKMITGGTYYVSCMMTLAQIELLITEKVMFENLR